MYSNFAVNKHLHTVASCWILLIYTTCPVQYSGFTRVIVDVFRDVTQRTFGRRRFGQRNWSHLQGLSIILCLIDCQKWGQVVPKRLVTNYQPTPRNVPEEERSSHEQSGWTFCDVTRCWLIHRWCFATSRRQAWTRSWLRMWCWCWRQWRSRERPWCRPSTNPLLRYMQCSTECCWWLKGASRSWGLQTTPASSSGRKTFLLLVVIGSILVFRRTT